MLERILERDLERGPMAHAVWEAGQGDCKLRAFLKLE